MMQHKAPTPLQQLIIERIQRERAITFADYMQMALYEPQCGYYTGGINRVGWEGDFYTSSDVTDFFAHCMARQLYRFWQQLDCPASFPVLEQGASRGALAREICHWAQREQPDFDAALRYRATDIQSDQDALSMSLSPLSDDHSQPAVILSNELIDAMPVHVVEKRADRLYEVYVTLRDGRLSEVLAEPSSQEVALYLDAYGVAWSNFADGWRAEINLAALQWIRRLAQLIAAPTAKRAAKTFILTVDYGEEAQSLYTRERYRGTLTGYYRHQLIHDPLLRPGEQDLTAHVNFSALIDEGRKHGLLVDTYTTQQKWLDAMGLNEELAQVRKRDFAVLDNARGSNEGQVAMLKWYNIRNRVEALRDPGGMGNFKVLVLSR